MTSKSASTVARIASPRMTFVDALRGLAALAAAAVLRRPSTVPSDPFYIASVWVGLSTAGLFAFAAGASGLYQWLSWRVLQLLGAMSYSIYLVHVPVIDIMMAIQKRLAAGSPTAAVFFLIPTFAATLLAAWAMNRWVERPSIRLASSFKYRSHDDLAGGIEAPAPIASDPMATGPQLS